MCNLQTVLSFPLGSVSLYFSSPPLRAALTSQPNNLQRTLSSIWVSVWVCTDFMTIRKSAGQRPHYNGEIQKEQIGHASPTAVPTQGGHMSTRLGAQANKAFTGAPSAPGQRGWRHTSLRRLLKGSPPGNMPPPSSESPAERDRGKQRGKRRVCQTPQKLQEAPSCSCVFN